jgi:hypothetical protein
VKLYQKNATLFLIAIIIKRFCENLQFLQVFTFWVVASGVLDIFVIFADMSSFQTVRIKQKSCMLYIFADSDILDEGFWGWGGF